MSTSENNPELHYEHEVRWVCDLCWERFPTQDALDAHIDQEEWTLYPMPVFDPREEAGSEAWRR